MSKLEAARKILTALQVPSKQQSDMCCYVLLAMAGIKKHSRWDSATNEWIRIHDVIAFTRDNYGVTYAENSRETVRKQCTIFGMPHLLRIMGWQQTARTIVTV